MWLNYRGGGGHHHGSSLDTHTHTHFNVYTQVNLTVRHYFVSRTNISSTSYKVDTLIDQPPTRLFSLPIQSGVFPVHTVHCPRRNDLLALSLTHTHKYTHTSNFELAYTLHPRGRAQQQRTCGNGNLAKQLQGNNCVSVHVKLADVFMSRIVGFLVCFCLSF